MMSRSKKQPKPHVVRGQADLQKMPTCSTLEFPKPLFLSGSFFLTSSPQAFPPLLLSPVNFRLILGAGLPQVKLWKGFPGARALFRN